MHSRPVAGLLLDPDLDLTKSHNRPCTSDDNPRSGARFKTINYRTDDPERFGSIEGARSHGQTCFVRYEVRHAMQALGTCQPVAGTAGKRQPGGKHDKPH